MENTNNQPTTEAIITPSEPIVNAPKTLSEILAVENRERPSATKFANADELLKAYENLEGFIGKKVENYGPEELAIINTRRGIPQDISEYAFPEGMDITDDVATQFRGIFKKAGITKNEALEIAQGFNDFSKAQAEVQAKAYETTLNEFRTQLKAEFGAAYDKKMEMANRALTQYGSKELAEFVKVTGLQDHPEFIKFVAKIGEGLIEDSVPDSKKAEVFGTTPDDARRRIELMMADTPTREAYYNRFDPKHEIVKREITELYQLAYNN
jgi:hypothetical protein